MFNYGGQKSFPVAGNPVCHGANVTGNPHLPQWPPITLRETKIKILKKDRRAHASPSKPDVEPIRRCSRARAPHRIRHHPPSPGPSMGRVGAGAVGFGGEPRAVLDCGGALQQPLPPCSVSDPRRSCHRRLAPHAPEPAKTKSGTTSAADPLRPPRVPGRRGPPPTARPAAATTASRAAPLPRPRAPPPRRAAAGKGGDGGGGALLVSRRDEGRQVEETL